MPPKMHTEDYYSTLEIHSSATHEEITKAFRTLALKWHPDKNREGGATEAFQLLNEAYEILKDPAQRGRYDAIDYPRIIRDSLSEAREHQAEKERSQQPKFRKTEWDDQEDLQPSRFDHAPKRQSRSRFDSAPTDREESPTPRARSKSQSRFASPEHESKHQNQAHYEHSRQAPNAEEQDYELGSRRYGNRARSVFFYLSAAMVNRGKREVRISEADDRMSRNALQLAINEFAIELRRDTQTLLSDEFIKMMWRSDPEGIYFRQKERESYESRRKQYFINAFPELLKPDGTLPDSWSYLWDAFSKDFSVQNQDLMDESGRENNAHMAEEEANATQCRWRKERPERSEHENNVDPPIRSGLPPRWPETTWNMSPGSKMATASNGKVKPSLAERAKARVLEAALKAVWDRRRQADDKKKRTADDDISMGGI